jgi:hypothetical protein
MPFAPHSRFLSLVYRLRIIVPGPLRFRRLAVPSSLARHRHASVRCSALKSSVCLRRSAPPWPLSLPRDHCFPTHRSLSLQRSRPLVAVFPSPTTAAASLRPPFQGQWSRPATSWPTSLPHRPVCFRLPRLPWFAPVVGGFFASCPSRLRLPARSAASPASTPHRDFYFPRDQSVQQVPLPYGSPPESARLPFAPRCRSISSVGRGSTFQDRYVFSG